MNVLRRCDMETGVWIVISVMAGGMIGYAAGFRAAKDIGCQLAVDLAKRWGKTPLDLVQALYELNEEMRK
jgi:hypothetical protein